MLWICLSMEIITENYQKTTKGKQPDKESMKQKSKPER